MRLRPLHDWAVIRPYEAEEMTAGGLYIPDTAKDKPHEGVVEAIGPGAFEEEKYGKKKDKNKERRFIPTLVKPGDAVLYERYAGQTYKIGEEELILVRERNILGILPMRPPRPAASPRPLQIPAATSALGSTALMKNTAPVSPKKLSTKKKATGKPAKKTVKKPSSKPAMKTTKKTTKKTAKKITRRPSKSAKGRTGSVRKSGKKK